VPARLAAALRPTLGGYLVTYCDWAVIFYVNVPSGIAAVILASIFLRELRDETRQSFDAVGFIFSTIGLACVLYGLSSASTDGWGSTTVVSTLIVGSLALVIFVVVELVIINSGGYPLLGLRLFTNGSFPTRTIDTLLVVFALI